MPTAHFDTGSQSAAGAFVPRQMVPGIEPGGSRVGDVTKPAILFQGATTWVHDLQRAATADVDVLLICLDLSQEPDLTPGLLLPVCQVSGSGPATAEQYSALQVDQMGDRIAGLIFAPKYVGIRVLEGTGSAGTFRFDVFLTYEVVEIPWMDWFVHWDFLDNVVNDSFDY